MEKWRTEERITVGNTNSPGREVESLKIERSEIVKVLFRV